MAQSTEDNVPTSLPDGYHLVWNDEFSINGRPDPSNWSFEEGFVRNHEWQWYQSDNAIVHDGSLIITAREERRPNPTYKEGSKNGANNGNKLNALQPVSYQKRNVNFFMAVFSSVQGFRLPEVHGPRFGFLDRKKNTDGHTAAK